MASRVSARSAATYFSIEMGVLRPGVGRISYACLAVCAHRGCVERKIYYERDYKDHRNNYRDGIMEHSSASFQPRRGKTIHQLLGDSINKKYYTNSSLVDFEPSLTMALLKTTKTRF